MERVRSILKSKGSQVWAVPSHATVYEAIAMMDERRVGALLVIDDGQLVGIVSERDYARKVILKARSSRDTPVSQIMTSQVLTVTPDHNVEECMRIMTEHRVRHLPVMDDGRLAGMVSIGDLVRSIISVQAQTIDHLHNYIAGKYPA